MEWIEHLTPKEREVVTDFVFSNVKLSMKEMAQALGVTAMAVSKLRRHQIRPSDETLKRMYSILDDKKKVELLLNVRRMYEDILKEIDQELGKLGYARGDLSGQDRSI
ncbi:sigma factor-like helix-turn-helix DNA-binding protein [Sulfolobus acidocaldarius]|uniref:HTH cro/C1-type domain-containing protein n=3 Tax=Sulfolobus acidocaldarius TaxID=2285 RepID=Q4J8N4_SULAC|nr:sigma factor-like helix-turn-helix DNA-binding protein [Sulfolobus acidocaldarius]AAY80843.1 hypothetical protein Saci_1525 [Sulfolobus acidocaldarius DSM 639]AGE71444.1 hypothetical protein SacN8_07405 [Sulfolobus acidocaldarius N8]AGE73717.1 hypothetical protein SacRon12I_07415 [Sulfolobus acidocaldarius Ron12/I]WCM35354.1 sigma-70 family RNA polymerase sigma factor [Sulfolobus acidocaldarius DSM 639]